jgi:putative oxidoreductase
MATTVHYDVEFVDQDRTAVSAALLATRLAAGLVMLPHGMQHLFGSFGGPGLSGTVQFIGPVGYVVAVGEFFGALALLAGVLTRFSAAALIVIMIGAVAMVHFPNGFFMNWTGAQKGEGFEYHLLMIGNLLPTLIAGPGLFAVSKFLLLPTAIE